MSITGEPGVRVSTRTDPRLGRHQVHDERSRAYAITAGAPPTKTVMHQRHIPIFDQGELGSCTANAGLGMISTGPLWRLGDQAWTEVDAVALYSEETRLDDREIPGHYPPKDTGSAGIYLCKALQRRGLVLSYQHAFSLTAVLAQLVTKPMCIGIPWYESMFTPDAAGRCHLGGALAGGHEVCIDGIDSARSLVRFANSWSASWGQSGWGWLSWADLGTLLAQGGDAVTVVRA